MEKEDKGMMKHQSAGMAPIIETDSSYNSKHAQFVYLRVRVSAGQGICDVRTKKLRLEAHAPWQRVVDSMVIEEEQKKLAASGIQLQLHVISDPENPASRLTPTCPPVKLDLTKCPADYCFRPGEENASNLVLSYLQTQQWCDLQHNMKGSMDCTTPPNHLTVTYRRRRYPYDDDDAGSTISVSCPSSRETVGSPCSILDTFQQLGSESAAMLGSTKKGGGGGSAITHEEEEKNKGERYLVPRAERLTLGAESQPYHNTPSSNNHGTQNVGICDSPYKLQFSGRNVSRNNTSMQQFEGGHSAKVNDLRNLLECDEASPFVKPRASSNNFILKTLESFVQELEAHRDQLLKEKADMKAVISSQHDQINKLESSMAILQQAKHAAEITAQQLNEELKKKVQQSENDRREFQTEIAKLELGIEQERQHKSNALQASECSSNECKALEREIAKARKLIDQLEDKKADAEKQLALAFAHNHTLSDRVAALEDSVSAQKNELIESKFECGVLQCELVEGSSKMLSEKVYQILLEERGSRIEIEVQFLGCVLELAASQNLALALEIKSHKRSLERERLLSHDCMASKDAAIVSVRELRTKLSDQQQRIIDMEEEKVESDLKLENEIMKCRAYRTELVAMEDEVQHLNETIKTKDMEILQQHQLLKVKESEIETLKKEKEKLNTTIDETSRHLEKKVSELIRERSHAEESATLLLAEKTDEIVTLSKRLKDMEAAQFSEQRRVVTAVKQFMNEHEAVVSKWGASSRYRTPER